MLIEFEGKVPPGNGLEDRTASPASLGSLDMENEIAPNYPFGNLAARPGPSRTPSPRGESTSPSDGAAVQGPSGQGGIDDVGSYDSSDNNAESPPAHALSGASKGVTEGNHLDTCSPESSTDASGSSHRQRAITRMHHQGMVYEHGPNGVPRIELRRGSPSGRADDLATSENSSEDASLEMWARERARDVRAATDGGSLPGSMMYPPVRDLTPGTLASVENFLQHQQAGGSVEISGGPPGSSVEFTSTSGSRSGPESAWKA